MTDESIMLDIDIIEKKHEEEMNVLKDVITEKNAELDKKNQEIKKLRTELTKAGVQV